MVSRCKCATHYAEIWCRKTDFVVQLWRNTAVVLVWVVAMHPWSKQPVWDLINGAWMLWSLTEGHVPCCWFLKCRLMPVFITVSIRSLLSSRWHLEHVWHMLLQWAPPVRVTSQSQFCSSCWARCGNRCLEITTSRLLNGNNELNNVQEYHIQ